MKLENITFAKMSLQEKILFYEIKSHSIEGKQLQTKSELNTSRYHIYYFNPYNYYLLPQTVLIHFKRHAIN